MTLPCWHGSAGPPPGRSGRFTLCSHTSNGAATTRHEAPVCSYETRRKTVTYKAEYIWIDGTEPTARLRSKTKVLADGADLPIWGFDGSSTNQAPGAASDNRKS